MSSKYLKEIAGQTNSRSDQNGMLSRFLDTNGDGTGTKNANGDYAAAAEIFYIQPPADQIYHIERMLVYIEDAGPFNADNYGGLAGALSNGISVRVQDDSGTILTLTDGINVDHNAGWSRYCHDVVELDFGAGNDALTVRWTFSRAGTKIRLNGANNERLEVVLNDSFVGIVEHYFMIHGYRAQ